MNENEPNNPRAIYLSAVKDCRELLKSTKLSENEKEDYELRLQYIEKALRSVISLETATIQVRSFITTLDNRINNGGFINTLRNFLSGEKP